MLPTTVGMLVMVLVELLVGLVMLLGPRGGTTHAVVVVGRAVPSLEPLLRGPVHMVRPSMTTPRLAAPLVLHGAILLIF